MTPEEIAQEVRDAYAAHDKEQTLESYLRVARAIWANTKLHNPQELDEG